MRSHSFYSGWTFSAAIVRYNPLCTWLTLSCSLSLSARRLWSSASVPARLSSASCSEWCSDMRVESSSSRSCSRRTSSSLIVSFSCSASRFCSCRTDFSSSSWDTVRRVRSYIKKDIEHNELGHCVCLATCQGFVLGVLEAKLDPRGTIRYKAQPSFQHYDLWEPQVTLIKCFEQDQSENT